MQWVRASSITALSPCNIYYNTCILHQRSPYDGRWSKTMVGFGPEDDHFVVELTYNYGVGEYKLGNDFRVR